MKYFILLFLLSPFWGMTQDCTIIRDKDVYTRELKLSTGFIYIDGGSVTIDADSKEIDVFFSLDGADKCFDDKSMLAIFFEGSKVKMSSRNGGSMNCQGFFHLIFRNTLSTQPLLQKIATQKITSLDFTGNNKKESKIALSEGDQLKLMNFAACLVKEAKTLIK